MLRFLAKRSETALIFRTKGTHQKGISLSFTYAENTFVGNYSQLCRLEFLLGIGVLNSASELTKRFLFNL